MVAWRARDGASRPRARARSTAPARWWVPSLGWSASSVGLVLGVAAVGGIVGSMCVEGLHARLGTDRFLLAAVVAGGLAEAVVLLLHPGFLGKAIAIIGQFVVCLLLGDVADAAANGLASQPALAYHRRAPMGERRSDAGRRVCRRPRRDPTRSARIHRRRLHWSAWRADHRVHLAAAARGQHHRSSRGRSLKNMTRRPRVDTRLPH